MTVADAARLLPARLHIRPADVGSAVLYRRRYLPDCPVEIVIDWMTNSVYIVNFAVVVLVNDYSLGIPGDGIRSQLDKPTTPAPNSVTFLFVTPFLVFSMRGRVET